MTLRTIILVAGLAAGGTAIPATAQTDATGGTATATSPRMTTRGITLGMGMVSLPAYPGSNDRRVLPLPVVGLDLGRVYLGAGTEGAAGGLGLHVVRSRVLRWTVDVTGTLNRPAAWSDDLAGLSDRGMGVTAGTSVRLAIGPARVGISGAWGLTRGTGRTGTLWLGTERMLSSRLAFSVGASATLADRDNMDWDFGVRGTDARRSGLREFSPSAGLRELRLSLAPAVTLSTRARLVGFGSLARLGDGPAASPLVKQRLGWDAGLAVIWRY